MSVHPFRSFLMSLINPALISLTGRRVISVVYSFSPKTGSLQRCDCTSDLFPGANDIVNWLTDTFTHHLEVRVTRSLHDLLEVVKLDKLPIVQPEPCQKVRRKAYHCPAGTGVHWQSPVRIHNFINSQLTDTNVNIFAQSHS